MINVIACFDQNTPSEEFITGLDTYNEDDDFHIVELDPFGSEFAHLQTPRYLDGLFQDALSNGMQIQTHFSRSQGKCGEVGIRTVQLDGRTIARTLLTYGLVSKCEGVIEAIRETHESSYEQDNFIIVIYNLGVAGRFLLSHIRALGLEKGVTFSFYGFPKKFNAEDLRTFDNKGFIETKINRAKSRYNKPKVKVTETLQIDEEKNVCTDKETESLQISDEPVVTPKKRPSTKPTVVAKVVKKGDEETIKKTVASKKPTIKTEEESSTTVAKKPRKPRVAKKVVEEENDHPASEESLKALSQRYAK